MLDVMTQKKQLRQMIRQQIALLPADYTMRADARILQHLRTLPEYQQARTVFCYVGMEHEINTRPFLQQVLADGKRLGVPLCVSRGVMEAREIQSLEELQRGRYGLWEPTASAPEIPMAEVDFAVIPCLAADGKGNRLGHGGGYYDRLFGRYPDIPAAILCRARLLQESLPLEEFDHRFGMTITEDEILR